MEFNQFEYFMAVARYENMTEAAEKLYVTQPALSKAISALEQEFDTALFSRTGGKLSLTDSGRILQHYIERINHTASRAEEHIRISKSRKQLTINITAKVTAEFLAQINYSFLQQFPGVNLKINNTPFSEDNDFTGNFVLYPSLKPFTNETHRTLFTEQLVAVLPRSHPLCGQKSVTLQELAGEGMVLLPRGHRFREILEHYFALYAVTPNVKIECDNYMALLPMVEAGAGISLVPAKSWGDLSSYPRICLQKNILPPLGFHVIFGWIPEEQLSPEAVFYRDFVLSYFTPLPERESEPSLFSGRRAP